MSEIKTLEVEVTHPDILEVDVDFGQTLTKIVAPEHYMGPFEFYPSDEDQVIPVKDKTPVEDICVKGITGEKTITENGTYNVLNDKTVAVDVPNRGYDIPKIDDGNAHIWIDVPDKFRNMTVYCNLEGTAIVSVDWGDGTEEETYYGRVNVSTLNHNYASSGFYHIVMKTIQEPANAYQKALGGTGNKWLLGGGDFPERTWQYCLVGFESGNWYIRGGQLLMGSMCVAAYYKRATGYAYATYLYNISYMRIFELPDIVTIIPDNFFENDRCISDFVIPERITSIGKNVFSGTANINIHIERITPPTLNGTLGTKCTPTIYVPAESLEAYKTATNWSNYADNIFEEPST